MSKISIIIPVLNEVKTINRLLIHIEKNKSHTIPLEIIVVDGGSTDSSQKEIKKNKEVILISSAKGRAKQMNAGANIATADVLYFLHADSFPPKGFDLFIINQIQKANKAGCFRIKFDYWHPVLLISQWFTRFNHVSCRGGDQSLFISKALFDEIGQYNENYRIYEDNEIIKKLYQKKQFVVIPEYLTTSARRYRENGVWKLQYHFTVIHLKNSLGHSAESMLTYYKNNIK